MAVDGHFGRCLLTQFMLSLWVNVPGKPKEQLSVLRGTHKEFYPQDVSALDIIEAAHCQVGSTASRDAQTGPQCATHTNRTPSASEVQSGTYSEFDHKSSPKVVIASASSQG